MSSFTGADPNIDAGMNFGMINALRTGNMILDMCIAVLIPVIMRQILSFDIQGFFYTVYFWFYDPSTRLFKHTRYVDYVEGDPSSSRRYYSDDSIDQDNVDRNNILQKAVRLYVAEHYPGLCNKNMMVNLVPFKKVEFVSFKEGRGVVQQKHDLANLLPQPFKKNGSWFL